VFAVSMDKLGVFLTFDTEMMINGEWNEEARDSMKPPSFLEFKR
jgi:hypothetical protein